MHGYTLANHLSCIHRAGTFASKLISKQVAIGGEDHLGCIGYHAIMYTLQILVYTCTLLYTCTPVHFSKVYTCTHVQKCTPVHLYICTKVYTCTGMTYCRHITMVDIALYKDIHEQYDQLLITYLYRSRTYMPAELTSTHEPIIF